MPTTATTLFRTASSGGGGATDVTWDTPNNVLNSSASYAIANNVGIGQLTKYLRVSDPIAGDDIDAVDTITHIKIIVRFDQDSGSSVSATAQLRITGGSTKTADGDPDSLTSVSFNGNLSYWGLTAQEALDFARNLSGSRAEFRISYDSGSLNNVDWRVQWVQVNFTYTEGSVLAGVSGKGVADIANVSGVAKANLKEISGFVV